MKTLLIPVAVLLLAGCGDSPSPSTRVIDANQLFEPTAPVVKPQYQSGDKVLSKLGVVCVIINCEIIKDRWKLYTARALMTDRNGITRIQSVKLYEFEIVKKIQ